MAIPSITRTPIFKMTLGIPDSIIEIDDALDDNPASELSYIFAPLTLSSSGMRGRVGGLSATLAALVLSSSHGSNQLRGALAQALSAATLNASGGIPGRTGALAQALAAQILSSSGASPKHGALAQTLAAQVLSAAGISPKTGTLAQALSPLAVSASHGTNQLRGTLAQTLSALSVSATGTRPVVWTPASLTSLAAWFDPSDFSTMWQDAAQTTPVTAVGQPIGYLADKSANGRHASQTTLAKRPSLGQNAGGKYYINCSTVGSYLSMLGTSSNMLNGISVFDVFVAAGGQAGPAWHPMFKFGSTYYWAGPITNALGGGVGGRRLTTNGFVSYEIASVPTTPFVQGHELNYGAATATLWINGTASAGGAFQTPGLTGTFTPDQVTICGDVNDGAYGGSIYGIVMAYGLTTAERTSLDTYLSSKY